MIKALREQKLTLIYLATTLLCISLATQAGARLNFMPLVLVGVISPLLLALAFSVYEKGWIGLKDYLGRPRGFRFSTLGFVAALLLPFALMIISIALVRGVWVLPNFSVMLSKLPILLVLMTGEEFGWRRYAFARLENSLSFMLSALLVAGVWWLWHFPGYLIGMGTPEKMSFLLFGLMLVPASVLLAYLYHYSKNIYLVILAHISSNMAFSSLPFLPEHSGDSSAFVIYTGMLWLLTLPLFLNKKFWSEK